jgi:hypothetical protein
MARYMWYLLSDGSSSQCYGFGAVDSTPIDDGRVFGNDDIVYQFTIYTATIVIEKWQYDQLIVFGGNPNYYGFSTANYYANFHSCVDFTWKALELAGINPSGFEGDILPDNNGDNVDEAFYKYLVGNLDEWQNAPAIYFDSYNTLYGSKDKDILQVDEKIDFAYGGGGDDELYGSKGEDAVVKGKIL